MIGIKKEKTKPVGEILMSDSKQSRSRPEITRVLYGEHHRLVVPTSVFNRSYSIFCNMGSALRCVVESIPSEIEDDVVRDCLLMDDSVVIVFENEATIYVSRLLYDKLQTQLENWTYRSVLENVVYFS